MSQTKAQLIDNLVQPITGALGSASAPTFSFTADPNTGIYSPGADQLAISTGGSGRLFVDASGRILVGNSATTSVAGFNGFLQLQGTNFDTATVALTNVAANNTGSYLLLGKARGGTLGGYTSVNNGDNLGQIRFMGADGTGYVEAAYIGVTCNGVPGTNNMPGRLFFSTNSGTSSVTERMCITPSGLVGVGTSSPGAELDVRGGANIGDATSTVRITTDGTNGYISTSTNHPLRIRTNNLNAITIDTSQRVGIGTTSPLSIFDVKPSSNKHIVFSASASYASNAVVGVDDGGNEIALGIGGNSIQFFTGTNERARIDSSGRLLVGTSSTSATNTVVIQGHSGGSTGQGIVYLAKGAATPANGDQLGAIWFSDNTHTASAGVNAQRDAGTWSGTSKPSTLVFLTTADGASSPTERMRISANGQLTHQAPVTPTQIFLNTNNVSGDGNLRSLIGSNCNNTASYHFRGNTDAVNNWYLYGNGTTSYSSDERLKKNIETTRDGYLEDLCQLRVVKYNWKNQDEGSPKELGLIAQEVEQVFPGLVQDDLAPVSDEDQTIYKQLKGSVLPVILLKALQEAAEKIEALEARLSALETA